MKKKKVIAQQVLSAILATALASNSSSFTGLSSIAKAAENTVENEKINSELQENTLASMEDERVDNKSKEKLLNQEISETSNILYSGQDGDLDWSINEDGLLTQTSHIDFTYIPCYENRFLFSL